MKMVEAVLPGDSRSSPLEHARSVLVDAQQEIASTFRTNTDQLSRATLPVASLLLEASDSMLEEEKSRSLHAHIDTLVAYELVAQELWARTVKTGPKSLEQTTSMVHEQLEHLQRSFPYTAEAVFESATVTAEELLDRRLFPSRAGLKNSGPSPALEGAGLSAYEKYMYSQKFVATAVATHKERLIRLGEERPDLVHTIDKLIGNIANSALDSSDSHCGKRFNKLIQAVHSVGLATRGSNGLVPRAFEVATVGNRSIDFNNFRNQLSRNALPDQVDAMVLAMGKFGEEWLGGREYHAVENVIRLERTLGEKKNLDEHIPQWELAFSGLFKSNPYDQEFFKTLNDRDRATLIVLAMQNGLGMQAKVQRLLQMPEATRLLAELATTKAADRFAGWGEAARVATLVYNESIRTTDQHISLAKKLAVQAAKVFYPHASREPGADDGSPRPPRKPDWGYIGIAGTVLVSIACGVIAKVVDNSATLPAPGVSTYEPTIGPTPIASISPDAMTARASATPKVDTMIGPAPSMVMSAFRYAPINNGEFGIPPTTQQWLNVIAGGATDSTIQSSLQATTLWADARAHCKDASTCMVAAASYTEPGNPNASRTAYFLRAPDGFILAASTNPDGSINVENSRWLPPLVARDGTPLVPYEVFNYGARTDACQIYPAPPADQRRVVWASPDGRVVAHQTLFGNGLAEFVVINHSVLFGDNNAFRDVCGKAFAARALNDGRLVGAFYPVGVDGNVIFANPTNADGKINTYAIFDPKIGEWLWKDGLLPTPTPEPSPTPDRVASFEIPADHAPFWGFDGRVGKLLTTQNERDFALYGAYFQPYLVNQHIETIGGQEVVVAEAVYQGPDGVKRNVDVIFDSQMLAFVDWSSIGTPKPIMGVGEEVIAINKIEAEVQAWINNKIQVPLYVVIGYGGIPSNIHDRNCDNICGVVDDVLLQMDPDDLLEFYRNGGVGLQDAGREVRLLVEFVANGQGNLRQVGEISSWPADQIRQFPFKP